MRLARWILYVFFAAASRGERGDEEEPHFVLARRARFRLRAGRIVRADVPPDEVEDLVTKSAARCVFRTCAMSRRWSYSLAHSSTR
jgi:hypothetical protein